MLDVSAPRSRIFFVIPIVNRYFLHSFVFITAEAPALWLDGFRKFSIRGWRTDHVPLPAAAGKSSITTVCRLRCLFLKQKAVEGDFPKKYWGVYILRPFKNMAYKHYFDSYSH
jgi:hypothetical protein